MVFVVNEGRVILVDFEVASSGNFEFVVICVFALVDVVCVTLVKIVL